MKIHDFKHKKEQKSKISMITCYDYPSARIVAETHIDSVLVGDTLAMVVHGHDTTVMANMEMMILHTKAVARGIGTQFLISDLPFLCHKISRAQTITNVQSLLQAGAQAVKIEGADDDTCETIAYLVSAGIPVIGHLGLMPQFIHKLGGYKIQGKNAKQQEILMQQALSLEQAGCFAVVLECVPQQLATQITQTLSIPTIGIGAGAGTDGQILVWHDLLGLQVELQPKFLKKYAQGKDIFVAAINDYAKQVQLAQFPTAEHSF